MDSCRRRKRAASLNSMPLPDFTKSFVEIDGDLPSCNFGWPSSTQEFYERVSGNSLYVVSARPGGVLVGRGRHWCYRSRNGVCSVQEW